MAAQQRNPTITSPCRKPITPNRDGLKRISLSTPVAASFHPSRCRPATLHTRANVHQPLDPGTTDLPPLLLRCRRDRSGARPCQRPVPDPSPPSAFTSQQMPQQHGPPHQRPRFVSTPDSDLAEHLPSSPNPSRT
ncbi:hypothetical protein ACLOJK_040974 [Asimina triloba]